MNKLPRRIIEEVLFEDLGPLTARDLLAMPRSRWEGLRAALTDKRNGKGGMVARCLQCGGDVYIRTSARRPLFSHYSGSDPDCPWYTGDNVRPADARAAQYRGKQESQAHRQMCELIGQLAGLDERFISSAIDEYLPPTQNKHGRYPDVLIEWEQFGKFAVEYQMSHTFQTEVSQRCIHYEREGIPLIWVLSSLDPDNVPQAVSDVVYRHRGNAFVLDQAAIAESKRLRTLVLNCYLSNGDSFDRPVLARFDALTIPPTGLPFLEDRIVGPTFERNKEMRRPYFAALKNWGTRIDPLPIAELDQFDQSRRQKVEKLIAASFSIVATANGTPVNYATGHPNITGMLNTFLNSRTLPAFAALLTKLIENTSERALLDGTVGEHLRRAISGHRLGHIAQVDETSAEWRLLKDLLPEALDPFMRHQLKEARSLPKWAT